MASKLTLATLLKPFDKKTIEKVMFLREFVREILPQANELIYDNYNALAIGWSLSEKQTHIICSMAIYRGNENLHFGFLFGSSLSDPKKILLGSGKQYRYVLVQEVNTFPKAYIKKLVLQSQVHALAKLNQQAAVDSKGKTILKGVSSKKRAPSKSARKKKDS
ncbi:MAG: hypothetical protein ACK514_04005 [Bacteroidota bacterium]|jgi:hypothetical protein|nr:hypothetical protein [Cytophagales bacterium]MCE2958452.1 hypothetical protein [Flammeovirgaceae bacterium]MCZ8069747.1 hypothetical protein [Cytophagales bacterium]